MGIVLFLSILLAVTGASIWFCHAIVGMPLWLSTIVAIVIIFWSMHDGQKKAGLYDKPDW